MTKVHVATGGNSSEREVSLRSATAVTAALQHAGYDVIQLDTREVTIDEITNCDVVFPVIHGAGGEDGTLQAKLEARNVRFVGSDSRSSALCFDKAKYRDFIISHNLPMAPGAVVTLDTYASHDLLQQPYVLKPLDGGSSIDTFIVRDPATAPHDKMREAFSRYPRMLVEELISGTEITVGVLDDTALAVIEIIPPAHGEFDYENKYNGATQELCPPLHVSQEIQQKAHELALKAHTITGCRDLSRTDMIVRSDGELFILETNTLPGMTDQSLLPKAAAVAGYDMPTLCAKLVKTALSR